MSFFSHVPQASADPILGLTAAFQADRRRDKVNLGVGAYKTENLHPLVLSAVRKAEQDLSDRQLDKEYLAIEGHPQYRALAARLVFGHDCPLLEENRIFTAQSPGGTGGLRVAGEFLKKEVADRIYVSDPSWANHQPVFQHAGLAVRTYPYYDRHAKSLDFDGLLRSVENMESGCPILLHACCHNPTGMDPTEHQWRQISDAIKEKHLLPFFDFAYQGFGRGLEKDAYAVRLFASRGHEMIVTASFSKNFGLYAERTGLLILLASDEASAARSGSQIKKIIRPNYSNPPVHGARIVATILASSALRREWQDELDVMRERIAGMRRAFSEGLKAGGSPVDFSFLVNQCGMFSFSGLSGEQVEKLRNEFAIYMPSSGRINVAGLSRKNLDYVIQAILSVLS